MVPRFCIFILVGAAITSTVLLLGLYRTPLEVLQGIGLSRLIPIAGSNEPSSSSPDAAVKGPPMTPYPSTNGSIPKTILVLATMRHKDNSWVEKELGDLLHDGSLGTAFYVTDDTSAPLHTPANKGHEAMAYLSYIIDSYDSLPDISIFVHAHREAWHNNYLLDMSSSLMIRHLNHEKVARDGYMNLRCHWTPGCPTGLDPMATEIDSEKREEVEIKDAWAAMFPFDELPEALAQPCCSQFATTRERIRNLPRERYVQFREWLLKSDLSDYISGRIFEYFWQYMLNSSPVYCPDPRICYCDGYNVCFEDVVDYEKYFKLATEWQKLDKQLVAWKEFKHIDKRDEGTFQEPDIQIDPKSLSIRKLPDIGKGEKLDPNVVDKWDRGDWLNYHINELQNQMSARKEEAFAVGRDPARRAAAMNAALDRPLKMPPGTPPWWI